MSTRTFYFPVKPGWYVLFQRHSERKHWPLSSIVADVGRGLHVVDVSALLDTKYVKRKPYWTSLETLTQSGCHKSQVLQESCESWALQSHIRTSTSLCWVKRQNTALNHMSAFKFSRQIAGFHQTIKLFAGFAMIIWIQSQRGKRLRVVHNNQEASECSCLNTSFKSLKAVLRSVDWNLCGSGEDSGTI